MYFHFVKINDIFQLPAKHHRDGPFPFPRAIQSFRGLEYTRSDVSILHMLLVESLMHEAPEKCWNSTAQNLDKTAPPKKKRKE
jgi:hypothetical protein